MPSFFFHPLHFYAPGPSVRRASRRRIIARMTNGRGPLPMDGLYGICCERMRAIISIRRQEAGPERQAGNCEAKVMLACLGFSVLSANIHQSICIKRFSVRRYAESGASEGFGKGVPFPRNNVVPFHSELHKTSSGFVIKRLFSFILSLCRVSLQPSLTINGCLSAMEGPSNMGEKGLQQQDVRIGRPAVPSINGKCEDWYRGIRGTVVATDDVVCPSAKAITAFHF